MLWGGATNGDRHGAQVQVPGAPQQVQGEPWGQVRGSWGVRDSTPGAGPAEMLGLTLEGPREDAWQVRTRAAAIAGSRGSSRGPFRFLPTHPNFIREESDEVISKPSFLQK